MLKTFFEAVTVICFFVGICLYLHFLAYAVSWGWAKGKATVPQNIYQYHVNKNENHLISVEELGK